MTNDNRPDGGNGKRATEGMRKPLPAAYRAPLAQLVKRIGEGAACRQIGISGPALARALAGLTLQQKTLTLIKVALSGA